MRIKAHLKHSIPDLLLYSSSYNKTKRKRGGGRKDRWWVEMITVTDRLHRPSQYQSYVVGQDYSGPKPAEPESLGPQLVGPIAVEPSGE